MPLTLTAPITRFDLPSEGAAAHADLLARIERELASIHVEMFAFDDEAPIDALVAAAKRGVDVWVIVDHSQAIAGTESVVLKRFLAGGFPPEHLCITNSEHGAISHKKNVIFGARTLVTGSTNWSLSAFLRQDNTYLVIESPALCADEIMRFNALVAYGRTHYPRYQVTA
jgi:phosphatidylserine/phosphatidylglycerophosphate/cardiolipin synthase-like enzyme